MKDTRTVIVIGSGPSGAVAAHELVRRGIQVVMLESGCGHPGGALIRVMGRTLYRRLHPAVLVRGRLQVDGLNLGRPGFIVQKPFKKIELLHRVKFS